MTTRFPTATELDRDRFVLSAGHASMLLYSLLYLAGYGLTLDDQRSFRHLGSPAAGHPERSLAPGIETTTGPLGRNLHFGIREHAMDAIVNGLTLHYLRAYGSTFLVFIDYMRGAIRLAALMGVPSIFVFTHDSIRMVPVGRKSGRGSRDAELRRLRPAGALYKHFGLTPERVALAGRGSVRRVRERMRVR
jgi:transketolase